MYLWQHRRPLERQHYVSFWNILSKQDQEFTDIQALGLDGFHYHSDYINSHDAIVLGEKVPMKQVKGCPETYDTEKLRQKLEKIKIEDILWPIYDRNLHDVVEDQIKVTKDIILIEGNWLLLKQEPWKSMQQYADYKILDPGRGRDVERMSDLKKGKRRSHKRRSCGMVSKQ